MDHSERDAPPMRDASRRFTTMEGWREVAGNLYYVAGQGLINLAVDPSIHAARYDDELDVVTRQASHTSRVSSVPERGDGAYGIFAGPQIEPEDPFADPRTPGHEQDEKNPFSNANAITTSETTESVQEKPAAVAEEPYHIFPSKQRWYVVSIIGAAGLFSGLSSNIYFPALDAIATVFFYATLLNYSID